MNVKEMFRLEVKRLIKQLVSVLCVFGVFGISLKFLTFQVILNYRLLQGDLLTGLFFPFFPNVFDSVFLIFAVLWMAFYHEAYFRR